MVYPADMHKVTAKSKAVSRFFKSKDIAFSIYFCFEDKDLESKAKQLSEKGEKDFIVIGNSQALNEFVNGVVDLSKVCVGIIAAEHNEFARMLRPNRKLFDYLEQIILKDAVSVDLIKCNDRLAVNSVSTGIDVPILESFSSHKSKNSFNFFRSVSRNIFSFGQMQSKVSIDGKKSDKQFLLLACCNGKYLYEKININPHANLTDEQLDLIVVPPLTNYRRFTMLLDIKKGKHVRKPDLEEHWCQEVKLDSEQIFKMNIDGQVVEMKNPTITILPKALNLYLGKYKLD